MATLERKGRRRFAKILVMTVILIPVLFGGALLCTDTAVLMIAESHMKTAADAAALAGARALADETRLRGSSDLTNVISNARTRSILVASRNRVLGDAPILFDNPSNSTAGDISVGYLAPNDTTSSDPLTIGLATTFNSVKVRISRDSSHGGELPTFFGGPLGIGSVAFVVTSTATAQNYTISGFQNVNNQPVNLLPMVLDVGTYAAMMARITTDQYSYSPTTKTVSAGGDGVPESKMFPLDVGSPGNWGTVNIGVSNNSTSTLVGQILNGISPAQLSTFPNSKIQLNTALIPPSITFTGNPGISAGMKDALTSRIGLASYVGIYDQVSGNGNNTSYRVVGFGGVRIMAVSFQGNPKYMIVQPALVFDQSAIPGTPQTSWTKGGLVKIHLVR